MPLFVNIMLFILACGAAACVVAMIVLAVQGEKKLNLKKLPSLEARALLDKKESGLRDDLGVVAEKMGLRIFAKVSLGELLQTKDEDIRTKWREALMPFEVEFAVCDPRTNKLSLVILPVESGATLDPRHEFIIRALEKAEVPCMQLGNYNRTGLEKAIKEHLAQGATEDSAPEGKKKRKKTGEAVAELAELELPAS